MAVGRTVIPDLRRGERCLANHNLTLSEQHMSKNTMLRQAIRSRIARSESGPTRNPVAFAVRQAFLLGALGAGMALPAFAQQAPQVPSTAPSAAPLDTVIVTGSLIAAPNEKSTSPIQV